MRDTQMCARMLLLTRWHLSASDGLVMLCSFWRRFSSSERLTKL